MNTFTDTTMDSFSDALDGLMNEYDLLTSKIEVAFFFKPNQATTAIENATGKLVKDHGAFCQVCNSFTITDLRKIIKEMVS